MYVGSVSGVCVYMVCVPLRDVFVYVICMSVWYV